MPIYEYQCSSCRKVHEVMQKFSDEPLKACPDCAGQVQKLMSMTSFALKGSGWYATDYKRAPPAASSTENSGLKSEATLASSESSTSGASAVSSPAAAPVKVPVKVNEATAPKVAGCGSGGCGHGH